MTIVPRHSLTNDPDETSPEATHHQRNVISWLTGPSSHSVPVLPPVETSWPAPSPHTAAGTSYVLVDLATLAGVVLLTFALLADTALAAMLGRVLLFTGTVHIGLKTALALYPGFGLHPDARLRRSMLAWSSAGGIAVSAILYLVPMAWTSIGLFFVIFAATGLLQTLGRLAARMVLKRVGAWGVPVHVSGTPDAVRATQDYLRAHPGIGFCPVDRRLPADTVLWADQHLPSSETLDALRRGQQDVIVISDLPRCRLSGVHPAEHGGELGLHLALTRSRTATTSFKRLFDIALSLPFCLLALPIVLLAALLIRMVDPGPAFYVQTREGQDGKKIGVLKLRTMYLNADQMLKDLLASDPQARAEWESHFKLRNDPRILPGIGTFLRASSLDELPQLWNVLKGDMSLVGPRPFPQYHLEAMPADFRSRRASVVPGLTGLWQISERSSTDLEGQQQLDDYYITGRSFWGDVSILLRTFGAVLGRRGAY